MSEAVDNYLAHLGITVDEGIKLEVGGSLSQHGVKGMKWGKRQAPSKLEASSSDTEVTKRVKADYNTLNDQQFSAKYATTKNTYAKRVEKHGDPYAAKNSEKDRAILEARDRQHGRAAELERQAFKTYSANGEKALKAAMSKYEKMELELVSNPDAQTASKMTKGEKIAETIGWVGIGVAVAGAIAVKAASRR